MSNDSKNALDFREEIAMFAAYCVGSCHGDWDPRTDAERERVMKNDIAFGWWRNEHERYQSTSGPYLGSDGPFINNETT